MNRKLTVALSSCALLTLALSACGASSEEQAREWARNVCQDVRPQAKKIQAANLAIAEVSEGERPPKEVQEADSAAFQDLSEAYAALADAVDEAGDPPVDDGAQVRQDAVAQLRDLSESYAELKETTDDLDTSDRGEFARGLEDLAERLQRLGETSDEALQELQRGELGEAINQEEGCQSPAAPTPDEGAAGGGA